MHKHTFFCYNYIVMYMDKYVDDFINYLEYERNYSNNTIIAYKNNILQLIDYLDNLDISNTTIFIKGSNSMKLYEIVDYLKES